MEFVFIILLFLINRVFIGSIVKKNPLLSKKITQPTVYLSFPVFRNLYVVCRQ